MIFNTKLKMENINFLKNHVMSLIEYEPELEWFLFGEDEADEEFKQYYRYLDY
ncbi:hypothetical protein [Leptotrichia sp. oral taxon 221]|uniref:hypothetical protein n=1 Tax=Leptotrichia sp. oral taxon 221 TaxID=712362 RepID=UPI0020137F97|nr:hypothetical protein [Leptotrichia sp. oral taxon 221]